MKDQVAGFALDDAPDDVELVRHPEVIRIAEGDILVSACSCNPEAASNRCIGFRALQNVYSGVLSEVAVEQREGVIGGAVLNDVDRIRVAQGRKQALHRCDDCGGGTVCGYDHRHARAILQRLPILGIDEASLALRPDAAKIRRDGTSRNGLHVGCRLVKELVQCEIWCLARGIDKDAQPQLEHEQCPDSQCPLNTVVARPVLEVTRKPALAYESA